MCSRSFWVLWHEKINIGNKRRTPREGRDTHRIQSQRSPLMKNVYLYKIRESKVSCFLVSFGNKNWCEDGNRYLHTEYRNIGSEIFCNQEQMSVNEVKWKICNCDERDLSGHRRIHGSGFFTHRVHKRVNLFDCCGRKDVGTYN